MGGKMGEFQLMWSARAVFPHSSFFVWSISSICDHGEWTKSNTSCCQGSFQLEFPILWFIREPRQYISKLNTSFAPQRWTFLKMAVEHCWCAMSVYEKIKNYYLHSNLVSLCWVVCLWYYSPDGKDGLETTGCVRENFTNARLAVTDIIASQLIPWSF